jgi:phosphopantetheine--protein transferase-like protein
VGIDIVDVADVAGALAAHGQAYLDHVYTPSEQSDCRGADGAISPELLARRFAVKEATRKAITVELSWTEVEVARGPAVRLPVEGWDLMVSTTVAGGLATAVVISERV